MDVSLNDRGIYVFSRFRLDATRRTFMRDGEIVRLVPRLFDTLLYLVENQGRIIEKDELLAAIWGGRIVEEANLTRAISTLRKVLQAEGAADNIIVTAPGRGYRFVAQVRLESGALGASATQTVPQIGEIEPALPASPPWVRPRPVWPRWWRGAAAALCLAVAGVMAWRLLPHTETFAPPPHSVAVLAFTNLSGDATQEYISDGIAEELIDVLGRLGQLRVAARMSAFSFKNKPVTIAEVARILNVGAVLEGSVRRQGSRMRITVHLVDAATGYQEWSHIYDADLSDLLQTQAEIAAMVAASLRVTLAVDDPARIVLGGTSNPGALDAYLRGLKLARLPRDGATDRAALAQFNAASALDPRFALAESERAVAIFHLASDDTSLGPESAHKLFGDALAAADRAIALAPALGEAHAARGIILDGGFFDFAGAVAELSQAHTLASGNASIEMRYSFAAYFRGHVEESLAAARRATELDPLLPETWDQLATALMGYRRYDAAAATLHYARDVIGVPMPSADFMLGEMALFKGDAATARSDCARALGWPQHQCLAMAYHAFGRRAEAEAEMAALRNELADEGAYNYAAVYAQWGATADALRWLAKAYELRDQGLADIATDPLLDPLRATAEFKTILRKMNFPQ